MGQLAPPVVVKYPVSGLARAAPSSGDLVLSMGTVRRRKKLNVPPNFEFLRGGGVMLLEIKS